jgi:parallel beta-helix repeat protein
MRLIIEDSLKNLLSEQVDLELGEGVELLRKPACIIILSFLVVNALALAFNVQPVKSGYVWTETIYINADGSISPSAAPISSVDNVTYTLTDNVVGNVSGISSAIVILRDSITIDGAGHTLQGTQAFGSVGIDLTGRSNVTIKNLNITAFWNGIWLNSSSDNNNVTGNNITNNGRGIELDSSSGNSIIGNNITATIGYGISIGASNNNSVIGNNVTNNEYGILLGSSSDNDFSGNNIAANTYWGIRLSFSSNNNSVSTNSFVDDGLLVDGSYGNVVTDNLVNGKPLVYLEDVSDYAVGDAGQVILVSCNNVTVENLDLSNTNSGIQLWETNNTAILGNNVTANNQDGISIYSSSGNSVSGNNITNNNLGINDDEQYTRSSGNNISGNNIANNSCGLWLYCRNDTIYHNNFMNNTYQAYPDNVANVWDDGYPSGGNYWSDYNGTDGNRDGIGDTPYVIDVGNMDRYPLMAPYGTFDAGTWNGTACSVGVMSNSTVSAFEVDVAQKTVGFNVTGAEGSAGFCRVTIPNIIVQDLWQGNYTLLVDGKTWPFSNWTDATNTYVYFNYTHSEHQTIIIPEFPSSLILPILMIVTLLAIVASRRKWPKHQTSR